MSERVCAVVVTFNRKELLRECIEALRVQTRSVDTILVIDNASTDGTAAMFESAGYAGDARVRYVRLPKNVGGAGGFHEGFKHAYQSGAEWIWAMDDDTIVNADALERLFAARERFGDHSPPDLLSCRVVWTDGSPHPMNRAWPKKTDAEFAAAAERVGTSSIRATTFVATLFHRRYVEEFGLPIAEYFIWSDDIEFTGRILRGNHGVLVPDSIAVHKTANKYTANDSKPERFYYHIRNTVWMLTRSSAWTGKERAGMIVPFGLTIVSFLRRSREKTAGMRAIAAGFYDGFRRAPRVEAGESADRRNR